jgi:putative phage-type endonuclease
MEQRTEEWFAARCGKVTASRVADIIAKTKTGPSASRENYLAQLVCERLTGKPAESYSNAAMQWGTETEPFARAAYELATDQLVEEVGLIHHPEIVMSGASPDGLVGDSGLIEIKCPNTATHIEYAISGKPPAKYHLQMLWQMECTGRQWCDFVSFDPRMPEEMQLFIVRFERDQERIDAIKSEVVKFLGEVDEAIASLCKVFNKE